MIYLCKQFVFSVISFCLYHSFLVSVYFFKRFFHTTSIANVMACWVCDKHLKMGQRIAEIRPVIFSKLGYFRLHFKSKSIRKRKKNIKENDFLIFCFVIENIKRKLNIIKMPQKFKFF